MSYKEELQMAYNTDCVLEVLREGANGISLRASEAILFGKKLITNCQNIKSMPFYDPRFIRVFSGPEEIDTDFICKQIDVEYHNYECLSPLNLLERIESIYK